MSKRTANVFAVLVIALVVGLPLWAVLKEAEPSASVAAVSEGDEAAQTIFQENCGPCHTLEAGATDGIVGPNLDESPATASPETVLGFIENGSAGRMPPGILQGERAELVADFVAKYAGR